MHNYINYILSMIIVFSCIIQLFAQNINLTVRVTNIKKINGKVYIAIYDDKNSFLNPNKAVKTIELNVNNNILKHTLSIPKGAYALALFHDSNSNGILDKNFLGIPSERYGFSNNVHPLFSEPSFNSTVIEIHKDLKIDIALLKW